MTTWEVAEGSVLDLKAQEAEEFADWLEAVGNQQPTPPPDGRRINRWVETVYQSNFVLIQASDTARHIHNLLAFKAKLMKGYR